MANPERQQRELVAGWRAIERGDPGAAEAIAREVLRQGDRPGPLVVIAYNLLGVSLMQQSRHEEALDVLGSALEQEPRSAGTHLNLGSALVHLGRHEQAVAHFRKAAELEPRLSQAHANLADSLKALGRLDEAVISYRAALALDPGFVPAHVNLGLALCAQGLVEQAEESFGIAIRRDPGCAEAHAQLGMVRRAQGRLPEAITCLERALSFEPDHIPALITLGAAYQESGNLAEAAARFERAITLDPGSADARHNLGTALQGLSRHDEAIACFREALRIAPRHKYTLGALLWGELLTCRWERRDAELAELSAAIREGAAVIEPFALTAVSEDLEEHRLCAQRYYEDRVKPRERVWKGERYRHGKIRVAYLSADFRVHAVGYCIAELIELHDRSRFEIVGASLGIDDGSAIRARLVRGFDRFVDLRRLGDLDAAKLLRAAEADVVVDLMGYTGQGRPGILAHRPAPIQAGYLGYPGTVGADFLDYILADRFVLPQAHQRFFAEKVAYLPDCYQANDRMREVAPGARSKMAVGLPETGFVFCCFNNSYKIAPRIFDVWMRLLAGAPASVLWMFADNAAAEANLRREAQARGVAPERLVFAARVSAPEYRARCRLADLCLDTLPYNGHGTTGDMLWSGLPVLTCAGAAFPGRVAGSLLHSLGLAELVARDMAEYEATALRLARNPGELAEIRAKLARSRSSAPLFDTDRFRRHIESAYTTMWEIAQRGEAPRSFSVSAIG
jgi:protein O-GlcNAc transferase